MEAADAALTTLAERAASLRQPYYLRSVEAIQAARLVVAGRFDEVEQTVGRWGANPVVRERASGPFLLRAWHFELRSLQGRSGELLAELEDAVARVPLPGIRVQLGWIYADVGRHEDARRTVERMLAGGVAALPRGPAWPVQLALLAETCAVIGDREHAAALYPALLPLAGRNIVSPTGQIVGPALRYLGLLAATLGRWDAAAAHFEEALALCRRMDAPVLLAQARYDYARMLRTRARAEDQPQAAALLDAARATAAELGMTALLTRIDAMTPSLPQLAPAPAHPDGLTEREAEVLAQIGRGRTNQEIADSLILSVRTVERHAVNIYAKIGAHSRADAVAYALRHGFA
jgi:DNA-binding CsgD family transcriptional regulator